MADYSNLPDFDSLPKVEGMPQGCAWGVFDKDGKKDHLGCINLLTPTVVQEAFKEARDGVSVSLNWPIGAINKPGFLRKGLEHKVFSFKEGPFDMHGFDDEVEFNTQCSSQWDSLIHYCHQPTGCGYNGAKPTKEQLVQTFGNVDLDKTIPSLNHWHDRGGLVGRGVLLDYRAYAEAKGIKYDCFDSHAISVQDLEAVAAHQGTKFKHGDILIVRSGFTEDLGAAPAEEQERMLGTHKAVGVKGCKETAKWVWNHHFAAVAGDAIAFEVLPPTIEEDGNRPGTISELVLHQYFLSLFGLAIGELWDLKALGAHCKKVGRYEFLLTSVPLNVPGAIGSPPNALAIF
ncbi:hypothetical protein AYL99_10154 [Fonsecaea erecta]|uniref:Cyclase n=1 Tax=Fonsecaea erecta TaxID=1367422 RepID=A0A178Z8K5_9EURO|nr:hypothetical protein AYL99_10154 [Fonsecaea erecta]OAP56002.1 hypothetical protein AYL99_10154 [Fonsecaea erecta]